MIIAGRVLRQSSSTNQNDDLASAEDDDTSQKNGPEGGNEIGKGLKI